MFNNMKVGTRLLAGFIFIALLGSVVATIGILNMASMNRQSENAYANDLLGLSTIKEANINLVYIGRATRGMLLARTPEEKAKIGTVLDNSRRDMGKYLEQARPLFYMAAGKAKLAELDVVLPDYDATLTKLRALSADDSAEGKAAAVDYLMTTVAPKASHIDDLLSALCDMKENLAAQSAAGSTSLFQRTRSMMIGLVVLSLVAGVGLGLWITRGLTRQLGGEPEYAVRVAGSIAAGDLSSAIDLAANDQRSLLFAMEAMRQSLVGIVREVRSGTDTIATASSQIASGNLDLSSRTEEQASSLEETASSMEELTSTVKQNADNARQANVLAVSASAVAQKGGSVVSQVVDTMASINESSRKIVDIIGVIDGIAFQTNILALNAAVEAARAGEQGRGFAVVASEVRNLAQRSASAAKEIKALIGDSVNKVEAGGRLVDEAGVTMADIVQSITRVTDIMAEIASASAEQFTGIEQINSAVSQMDEVTQQNAALVEEAAAAAGSLQDQAATLAQVVSVFKLSDAAPARAAMRAPAAPARTPSRGARPALAIS